MIALWTVTSLFSPAMVLSPSHGNRPYRTTVRPNRTLHLTYRCDIASAAWF